MAVFLKRAAILLFFLMFGAACAPWLRDKPITERHDMEKYAEERYVLALEYMEAGRYELARQQFSVAAASAESPELREMAQSAYEKAEIIIQGRR